MSRSFVPRTKSTQRAVAGADSHRPADGDGRQESSYSKMLCQTSSFDQVVDKWRLRRTLLSTSMDVAPFDRATTTTTACVASPPSPQRRSVSSNSVKLLPIQHSPLPSCSTHHSGNTVTAAVVVEDGAKLHTKLGDLMAFDMSRSAAVSSPISVELASPLPLMVSSVGDVTRVSPVHTSTAQHEGRNSNAASVKASSITARGDEEPFSLHVYSPLNTCRPRTYLRDTLQWAVAYTDERRAYEKLTDVEMDQVVAKASLPVWTCPQPSEHPKPLTIRPGDSIAKRIDNSRDMKNRFLTKVRQYMAYVETMVETENEAKKNSRDTEAAERAKQEAWSKSHPFELGGVLDSTLGTIAQVGEAKFASIANRYYTIAFRNRQNDIDLKEQWLVKLDHTTYKLGSVMTYEEFCVCYRQFQRYSEGESYLVIARIPKQGWIFVDKVIKTLITRKIDKNKTGKIVFPDLLKHLFPAMSIEEISGMIGGLLKQYLEFSDKTVRLFLDTLDVDKVNHFGVVFSMIDKLGNGIVTRDEFIANMPIENDGDVDEEEVKRFLGELFDGHARRDMNAKLELVGEAYFDLDCMALALSISRYNSYGGTIMAR